jgi:hypothetical protein
MRTDTIPGAIFPDYELSDNTAKRRKLSELQGQLQWFLLKDWFITLLSTSSAAAVIDLLQTPRLAFMVRRSYCGGA